MSLASTALGMGLTELLRSHGTLETHTPSVGDAVSLRLIYAAPYEVVDVGGQVSDSRPSVVFRNSDTTMARGETVTVEGSTLYVTEVEGNVAANGSRRAFVSQDSP